LGEKLLKDAKGFSIMDDPCIKADIERLTKQLNAFKRIPEERRQTPYFTTKDEAKNASKKDLTKKTHQLPRN
jgi:hypothetical protein